MTWQLSLKKLVLRLKLSSLRTLDHNGLVSEIIEKPHFGAFSFLYNFLATRAYVHRLQKLSLSFIFWQFSGAVDELLVTDV